MTLACAAGVAQAPDAACHRWRGVALSWAMSSRLAARAAARFLVAFLELQAQVNGLLLEMGDVLAEGIDVGGRANPDSRHACSPSAWDWRFSSCRTRAARPPECMGGEQVGLQRRAGDGGPAVPVAGGGALRERGLAEQVAVPVEEGPVHGGSAGDARYGDLGAVVVGAVECGNDALAATRGVGFQPSSSPRSAFLPPRAERARWCWSCGGLACG